MNETSILTQEQETTIKPEDWKSWKENITHSIDLLNEQEKLVVALHYHEELTLPETAQVLDIPISKVKIIIDKTLKSFSSGKATMPSL
jgi:DNA-directed RNA polymerase specialized sigma subunit